MLDTVLHHDRSSSADLARRRSSTLVRVTHVLAKHALVCLNPRKQRVHGISFVAINSNTKDAAIRARALVI